MFRVITGSTVILNSNSNRNSSVWRLAGVLRQYCHLSTETVVEFYAKF